MRILCAHITLSLLLSGALGVNAVTTEVHAPFVVQSHMLVNVDLPLYLNSSLLLNFPSTPDSNQTSNDGTPFPEEQAWDSWTLPSFDEAFEWYGEKLETHPFATKSVTASIMGATGDVVAQAVEAWTVGNSFGWAILDARRTFSLGVEGFFISGPFMHMGYELLEECFPVFAESQEGTDDFYYKWFMVICQVLVDALIMDSFFVATTIVSSGILEGGGWGILEELKKSYIPACQASYISSVFWSPVQLMSFKYVPLPFRVAAINLQDIAWFATISYMAHRCRHKKGQATDSLRSGEATSN